jgi:hypothetical protein
MKNSMTKFYLLIAVSLALAAACDDGSMPDSNQKDNTEVWSVIKSQNDLAGVWEGSSNIEFLGDEEHGIAAGDVGINIKILYQRNWEKADLVVTEDFSDYLDTLLVDNPESAYTKDSLWTEVKNTFSGSGYSAGNYYISIRQPVYVTTLLNADDLLINPAKNKIKQLMPKSDFAYFGVNVASDITTILDKVSSNPAALIIKNDNGNGAGEYIKNVKILRTGEPVEKALLGIGQNNENYNNDGESPLYLQSATNTGRGSFLTFNVPADTYYIKVSLYRGGFLGWLHCQSESFTIDDGEVVTLTYAYIEYDDGSMRMGIALSR